MAPPTSVILPTVRWTTACQEVTDQLGPDDELLIVCDGDDDPVAEREGEFPDRVRLVVAGEPEGCSGKANAIIAGMEAASHDRLVWTDDDFHHPPDWLDGLHEDYREHGPVTELPYFVGCDPLSLLLEPTNAIGGTLGVYTADKAWGGAVMFERGDIDWDEFLADLSRTISDDGLLSEYLDVTAVRRTRTVEVGGTISESLERNVRFSQIAWRHEPRDMSVMLAVGTLVAIGCLVYPLAGFLILTLLQFAVQVALGVRRWTVLLAYLSTLISTPLLAYGIARRTFVWGRRSYRWRSKFDVEIVTE